MVEFRRQYLQEHTSHHQQIVIARHILISFLSFLDHCKMPLGIEDFRIPSGAFQASSFWNYNHGPDRARINMPSGRGRSGAWVARQRNANQWLQVELGRPAKVTGVATQGRHDAHQWVTSYTVSYSLDGKRFRAYLEYGRNKVGEFFSPNSVLFWLYACVNC